jgi:diguanylate cyclase (GGDEF)-like protein
MEYPLDSGFAELLSAPDSPNGVSRSLASSNPPNPRVLVPEQSRRLQEINARISETPSSVDAPRNAIGAIGEIVGTKVALLGKDAGTWTVLAEGATGPALPQLTGATSATLDRVGDGKAIVLEYWRPNGEGWTLVGLTRRAGSPAVLVFAGDWTRSATSLLQLGQNVLLAECAYALASAGHVRVATHRLTRELSRATGVRNVAEVAIRNAARAVRAQLAALAVADPDGQNLSIMATHGYPLTLVEHLRIPRGEGVLGSVFQSGLPLRVNDVAALHGTRRRRSRYRTNSFAVVPIASGREILGAMCVTDRTDGRPFSHHDLSTLRTLAATVALALVRERAHAQAYSYAQAAAIDPVSGLFNRRYFQARLEEELQRAQRHALAVGLLMIDVDDFKSVNDTFGHLAGDAVIRDIGEILRRSVRVFDICTRFGGEEFAVVMPGSGADDAARIAERIRERIEAYRAFEPDLAGVRITVSIGLSVSTPSTSARDLIHVADQALYQAKRAGKNQVCTGDMGQGEQGPPS